MAYQGDIALGQTLDFNFTTRQISGAPSTLSSSPVLSCYVGNSTTEITAGITLSVDFDSRTGLNHVRIVASGGNGYATASDYSVVITTGTVNSVSVVGEVIGEFSIENRQSNVKFWNGTAVATPATAGIPDVNVKNMNNVPATPITTIKAVQGLAVDGVINTLTNLPAITANWLTAAGINAGALNGKGDWSTYAGGDTSGTTTLLARLTAGRATNLDNLDAAVSGRMATFALPANFSVLGITAGGLVSSNDFTTALTESYRANGATGTPAQILYELLGNAVEANNSGTTRTVKKLDHSTTAATYTYDNATPNTITRAT